MTFWDFCQTYSQLELLSEWHKEKNGDLSPRDLTYGSSRKVWWVCKNGHEWQASVYTRRSGRGCPYCKGKLAWKGENDFETLYPHLAAQWHPEKNGQLRPADVKPGSQRMVWWRCEEGHEWVSLVKSRTQGYGCPICHKRKVEPHVNDFTVSYPELAEEWHPEKNGTHRPEDFVSGTKQKVWWRCDKGHEWQASILSRTSHQTGCPVCSGKAVAAGENDLATLYPNIAAQWHPEKNAPLSPRDVTAYSNRRAWWICEEGHEWQAIIATRSGNNCDCPVCANRKVLVGFNDLATVQPKIAAQWAEDMNGMLTPEMVTAGSRKRVWWRCSEGHVWKAVIYSRAGKQKTDCPVCAGNVKKTCIR